MFLGIFAMGPASMLGSLVLPSKGLIYISMLFFGLADSFNMVSSFARAHRAAMTLGYSDNINTYLVISGTIMTYTYLTHTGYMHALKAKE